nr:acetylserotonin O-methyltransferase-like [Quercus suber]
MEKTQREAKWNEEEQADVDIWKYILGFTEMAVVRCAIELGIPDTIESHGSPMTLSELSSTLGCAPSPLYRIMRFLMHRGIFKGTLNSQGSPGYAQTPLSRRLIKHGEHSMAALILLESSPVLLTPWLSLSARVLDDDTSSFEVAHGEDIWSYSAANPAHGQPLFWKLWHHMIFGYGMHFLSYLSQIMTLMYSKDLLYFLSSNKDVLLQLITQSMAMSIQWDTTLPMAYIRSGQHLLK